VNRSYSLPTAATIRALRRRRRRLIRYDSRPAAGIADRIAATGDGSGGKPFGVSANWRHRTVSGGNFNSFG